MTHHLMDRPLQRGVDSLASGPVVAGFTAALVGLATTAAPVLVLWVLSPYPQDTAGDAGKLVGGVWLLAHGGPLVRGAGAAPLSLTPLLATLLTVLLVYRAAERTVRRAGGRAGGVPAALCAGYLAVALPVALECSTAAGLRARVLPDLLAVAALVYGTATVGAGTGAVPVPRWWPARAARLRAWTERWTGPLPESAELAAAVRRAATGGLLTLLAGSALLFAVLVLLGTDRTDPVVRALTGGGASASVGLLLSCLLLVPNAVLWCASYALGSGFLLGAGTMVAPDRVTLGAVPEFPLFALVPSTASLWQYAVFALPVLAGSVCAGLLGRTAAAGGRPLADRVAGPDDLSEELLEEEDERAPWCCAATTLAGVGAALAVGTAVAPAAWLAGGAVGAGRMAVLGPSPWWAGLLAAGWFAALTVPGALGVRWWLLRPAGSAGITRSTGSGRWSGWVAGGRRALDAAVALVRPRSDESDVEGDGEGG
ncbi:hypothetical protein P3T36_004487 [Kitasatospora sp. MAP12-15]|uniref:cell division protein PerM n=1 Tax=unclassified Kitasatospora TaxID=2633591 RepID=UPI002473A7F2|nr:DUF6350 family protein [Kitasatospora sp. MAP12-44]MDH6110914.1 hypothetical protein [Kitasatospora sp. MAP12-44]